MKDLRRVAFVNAKSRRGEEWIPAIEPLMDQHGVDLICPDSPDDLIAQVTAVIKDKVDEVWVAGGDGTIGTVIGLFIGSETTLGVLPFGTGNSLAKELGIPQSPVEALEFLANQATKKRIDVGQVNDRHFCTVATVGLTTEIAASLQGVDKSRLGRLLYLPAVFKSLRRRRSYKCTITNGGSRAFQGRLTQFVVSNTRTHAGPFTVTADAEIDDGKLSAYWLKGSSWGSMAKYAVWLADRESQETSEIGAIEAESLTAEFKKVVQLVVDGDLLKGSRFEFRSSRQAVFVLAQAPVSE